MDYRVIEELPSALCIREPNPGELLQIGTKKDTSHLIWVLIQGVLHEDTGTEGRNRLLGLIAKFISSEDGAQTIEQLAAIGIDHRMILLWKKDSELKMAIDDGSSGSKNTYQTVEQIMEDAQKGARRRRRFSTWLRCLSISAFKLTNAAF